MFFQETREVDTEIIEGKVGDGDAARQVFKVDDGILELEELLAAVFQIIHLVAGLVLDDVFFACGGNIERTIRPLTRCSRLMYSSNSMFGQKLTSWMRSLGSRAVDPAEALDDTDGIPVDVVVDDGIAVLEF